MLYRVRAIEHIYYEDEIEADSLEQAEELVSAVDYDWHGLDVGTGFETRVGLTWDDLYERADGKEYGSPELEAKDRARYNLQDIIYAETGIDIEEYDFDESKPGDKFHECDGPEEAIRIFLEQRYEDVLFDEDGDIVKWY